MAFARSEAAAPAMEPAAPVRANPGLRGAIGIVAGLAAIAASSCCVLPLMLAALGAGAACATQPRNWAPLSLLLLATLIVVLAIVWNYLEFPLLRLMRTT